MHLSQSRDQKEKERVDDRNLTIVVGESIVDNNDIVIQVNGKKRGIINIKKDLNENEIFNEIKKDDKLSKYIDEDKIKKRIYIKNKIINLIL
mgnify:CR=1 FL=1